MVALSKHIHVSRSKLRGGGKVQKAPLKVMIWGRRVALAWGVTTGRHLNNSSHPDRFLFLINVTILCFLEEDWWNEKQGEGDSVRGEESGDESVTTLSKMRRFMHHHIFNT